jgi:hypothetical protein
VQLNLAICDAADNGVEKLLQCVENRKSDMNLVNFSTALHRLARLAEESKADSRPFVCDPRFGTLVEGARAAFFGKEKEGKARCLSTIAWSCARLGACKPDMMQEISELALPRIKEFKPYELGILLWSFAKVQTIKLPLFHAASEHILKHLDEFNAPCLATVAWAFATGQIQSSSSLIRRAADAFALRVKPGNDAREVVKPVALENMMWALATMQVHPKRQSVIAIADVTRLALRDFKVHEFTITMWAFARLGVYHERLFSDAAELVQSSPTLRSQMHEQGIANILWAFAKCAEKDASEQFSVAVTALLPTCQKLLPKLKPQELGCMLCSLSKLGKPWGENQTMDKIFFAAAARMGTDSHYLASSSFQSVVNSLGAYARFMRGQQGTVEPVAKCVMNLICLCPRFEDKFDAQPLLTILESLPLEWAPTPQVERALETVACAIVRKIDSFPQPWLARLVTVAKRFPGEPWRLIAANARQPASCSPATAEVHVQEHAKATLAPHGGAHASAFPRKPETKAHKGMSQKSDKGIVQEAVNVNSIGDGPAYVSFKELSDTIRDDSRFQVASGIKFCLKEPAYVSLAGGSEFVSSRNNIRSLDKYWSSCDSTTSTITGYSSRSRDVEESSDTGDERFENSRKIKNGSRKAFPAFGFGLWSASQIY